MDDEWIFSDEAHDWMDKRREMHHGYINPERRCVSGYEYGLFGFKFNSCADVNGRCYHDPQINFVYVVCFEQVKLGEEKLML